MNDSNNLLILNLGIDTNDTSLGFTQTWIEALSKEYSTTDVITMRLGKSNLSKDINVYFINENGEKLSKIRQYIKIQRTIILCTVVCWFVERSTIRVFAYKKQCEEWKKELINNHP